MKRQYLIAALMALALVGCGPKAPPPGTVQQCGTDVQTNETKCVYVPAGQAQAGYVQPGYAQPQVIQQPQVVQAAPAAPVIVNNTDHGGDAVTGMAVGMMMGHTLSNTGSRYDDSYARSEAERRAHLAERRADRAEMRADLANHKAALAAQQAPVQQVVSAPVQAPQAVSTYRTPSQTLTIPPKSLPAAPNFAPKQVVSPTYVTKAAPTPAPSYSAPKPVAVSFARPSVSAAPKNFAVSRPSTISSFKR